MTNIEELLTKVKGDKLSAEEFVSFVTAVIENQQAVTTLTSGKVGYAIKHVGNDGVYLCMFQDEESAQAYILNPEDPDHQPIVSIPLPSGGGGESIYEVELHSNTTTSIASANRNVDISLAFTTRTYVASTDTWKDNSEDGIVTIYRKVGDGGWELVKTISNFTRTLYENRDTDQKLVNLSDCLINGEQQIMIGAKGSRTEAEASELIFDIFVAEMSIKDATIWQEPKIYNPDVPLSSVVGINYNIGGSIDKSIYYKVYDSLGNVIIQNSQNIGTQQYLESSYRLEIPHPIYASLIAGPGIIKVESWLVTNNAYAVSSEHIFINVMVTTSSSENTIFVTNNFNTPLINWTSNSLFKWAVYNVLNPLGTNVRFVISNLSETVVWIDTTIAQASNNTLYDFAPYLNIENVEPIFDGVVKVYIDNNVVFSQSFAIDNRNSFAPTQNANFILIPSMRSNNEQTKEIIINETQVQGEVKQIQAVWNNVIFEKDGWVTDEDNIKVLKLFANSSVTIPYSPYTNITSGYGLTMEFDINVQNISDETAPMIKIGYVDNNDNFVGLYMCPKAAYMYSNLKRSTYFQDVEWGEDKRVHIAVNIMPGLQIKGNYLNVCRMFINGCIENEFQYDPYNDVFGSLTDNIVIGSTGADILIYGIRFYKDRQLSSSQILNDYIASLSDVNEKLRLIDANNILDNGVISYDLAKTKYNTLVWHGNYPDISHKTTYNGYLDINIIDDPDHSGTITNMKVKGQGTSAKTYYKWNGTFSHTDNSVWIDGNGVTKGNYYQLSASSPKMKKEVGKINYASSPQSHKAGACEAFNLLHKEVLGLTGIQRTVQAKNISEGKPSDVEIPRVAIEEKPFLFFVQTENDSNPVFYCLMTWGSAKGDAPTFGYSDNPESSLHDYVMLEGTDHSPALTLNQAPWFPDEVTYNEEEEYYMYNGQGSWDFDLGNQNKINKIYEGFNFCYKYSTRIKTWSGSINNLKNSQGSNPSGSNYADRTYKYIIVNSPVSGENFTVHRFNYPTGTWVPAGITKNAMTNEYDQYNINTDLDLGLTTSLSPTEVLNICKAGIISKFRDANNGVSQYFNIPDMLFVMQYLKFIAASDNRAKNTYIYYDPIDDKIRSAQDDLDTIMILNNQGQKQKEYWVEEHDIETRPGFLTLWAGGENAMYNTFEDAYRFELEQMMNSIFNAMRADAGSTIEFFNKYFFYIQNYFPATAYNENAKLLYEEAIFSTHIETDTPPLTQSRGRQLEAEYDWMKKRIVYMASYCSYKDEAGSVINFRQESQSIYDEIPAMRLYLFRGTGETTSGPDGYDIKPNGTIYSQRTDAGVSRRFTATATGTVQSKTYLAEFLSDIGDLSGAAISQTVDFRAGKRLKKIKIGSTGTPLCTISEIVGIPENIEELDLRNVSTLETICSLEDSTKLQKIYATGTAITGIVLPQSNNITNLTLPSTIQRLVLRNQTNISEFNFVPTSSLIYLVTGNCNVITQTFIKTWIDSIETNYQNYHLEIDGINWTNFSATDLVKLSHFGTIILRGTISLDASSITPAQLEEICQSLGVLLDTGELVLHYRNIITVTITPTYFTATLSTSTITVQALNDNPLYIKFNGEDESDLVEIVNKIDTVTNGRRTITGTIQAKHEISVSESIIVTATDNEITSNNFNLVVRPIIHITGVSLSVTSKYFSDLTPKVISAELSPSGYSDIPSLTWEISYLRDTTNYYIDQDEFFYYIKKFSNNDIVVRVPVNGGGNYENQCVVQINELVNEHFNDDDIKVRCNVYVNNVLVTYSETALVLHAYYQPYALQTFDENELNYNPAVMIALRNAGVLTNINPNFFTENKIVNADGSFGYAITIAEATLTGTSVINIGGTGGIHSDDNAEQPICYKSFRAGIFTPTDYMFDSGYCLKHFNYNWTYGSVANNGNTMGYPKPSSAKRFACSSLTHYPTFGGDASPRYLNIKYLVTGCVSLYTTISNDVIILGTVAQFPGGRPIIPKIIIFTTKNPITLDNVSFENITRILVPTGAKQNYTTVYPDLDESMIFEYDTENDPEHFIDRYDGQIYLIDQLLVTYIENLFPINQGE